MTIPPPIPGPQTPGEGLPEVVPGQVPQRPEADKPLITLFGDVVRTGMWNPPRRTTAYSALGNLKLDLRDVLAPGETLEIVAYVVMGDVRVLVPPGTTVDVDGVTLVGDGRAEVDMRAQGAAPTGARVSVTVYSLLGNVRVRTMQSGIARPPVGWRWARPRP